MFKSTRLGHELTVGYSVVKHGLWTGTQRAGFSMASSNIISQPHCLERVARGITVLASRNKAHYDACHY